MAKFTSPQTWKKHSSASISRIITKKRPNHQKNLILANQTFLSSQNFMQFLLPASHTFLVDYREGREE